MNKYLLAENLKFKIMKLVLKMMHLPLTWITMININLGLSLFKLLKIILEV